MSARARGSGAHPASWWQDFAVGFRLAMASGRSPKAIAVRLSLATTGIGLLVAVLLLGSALYPALQERSDRLAARQPVLSGEQGAASVSIVDETMRYRGAEIQVRYLAPSGPNAPVPPGLEKLPDPGEAVVSPGVADLLDSPEGELLRPRLGESVVGVIGHAGVSGPAELFVYIGADGFPDGQHALVAYGFGTSRSPFQVTAEQLVFVVPVTAGLVVPLLVFIATTSRAASSERERRLSAIRLVGADARQIRRIAAAEPMVGLATGGTLGVALFLLARQLAARVSFGQISVFASDLTPPWWMVVVTAILVPVLTIGASWMGMRSTIVEPLGVSRRAHTVRRRGWWRLLLVAAGVLLLFPDVFGYGTTNSVAATWAGAGAVLLLLGIPVLIPWLTDRLIGRLRGGTPAGLLAVRRLQQDSASPTRVVAGVVVILAAGIAMHMMMSSIVFGTQDTSARRSPTATVSLTDVNAASGARVLDTLQSVNGVRAAYRYRHMFLRDEQGTPTGVLVSGCARLRLYYAIPDCTNGQAYRRWGSGVREGSRLTWGEDPDSRAAQARAVRLPEMRTVEVVGTGFRRHLPAEVLLTPAAAERLSLPGSRVATIELVLDRDADVVERIRNALHPLHWRVEVSTNHELFEPLAAVRRMADTINAAIAAVLGVILGLAGVSLLVTALGQVHERKRSFAAMSAAGVPTAVLARAQLWQNLIPLGFGAVLATAVGIGVGARQMHLMGQAFTLNWSFVGSLLLAVLGTVLVVTLATLPAVRTATRLETLRVE